MLNKNISYYCKAEIIESKNQSDLSKITKLILTNERFSLKELLSFCVIKFTVLATYSPLFVIIPSETKYYNFMKKFFGTEYICLSNYDNLIIA